MGSADGMSGPDPAREQEDLAASEAARIGGSPTADPPPAGAEESDEAVRPVEEAGGGQAEGFEQAERELIEHASHGDQHAARRATQDAPEEGLDTRAVAGGEADHERSSERDEDLP